MHLQNAKRGRLEQNPSFSEKETLALNVRVLCPPTSGRLA